MKFKPTLDDRGYIESLTQTGTAEDTLEVDLEQTRQYPLFCFKPVNDVAVFDQARYDEHLQKLADELEIAELKAKLQATDYIYNVIREGDATEEYYAEVIANRKIWRARVRELEGDDKIWQMVQ